MDLGDIPLFAMLRGRLGYLADRQKVIAENVANASTPGYVARDLKPFSFHMDSQGGPGALAVTQPGHMSLGGGGHGANGSAAAARPVPTKSSEVTLDGNGVVLEEEMLKMGEARMDYDAAISFYQKSMNLIRLATRAPGR